MEINDVPGLEIPRDGLGTNASQADLSLGLVRIDDIDVQRDLPMDADWLYLLHQSRFRSLQHLQLTSAPSSFFFDPEAAISRSPQNAGGVLSGPCIAVTVLEEGTVAAWILSADRLRRATAASFPESKSR
jgi:hypothetical protein